MRKEAEAKETKLLLGDIFNTIIIQIIIPIHSMAPQRMVVLEIIAKMETIILLLAMTFLVV